MAKRFTDTDIWDKGWFRKLSPKMKEAWRYLCEKCDHAGFWEIDMETMSYFINEPVTTAELQSAFGDRISFVNSDKIFVRGFIEFQYKCPIESLNPKNKVHNSVLNLLKKHGVIKPLGSPLQGLQDQDKDKDKDKDKEGQKNNASLKTEIRFRFAKEIQEIENLLETLYDGPVPKSIKSNIPAMLIACSGDPGKVHRVLEDLYQSPKISSGQGLTGSRSAYVTAALREAFDLGGGAA